MTMSLAPAIDRRCDTGEAAQRAMACPLSMQGLCKRYPGRDSPPPALHEFTLALLPGELLSLVGPNGAGKSTLLRIVAGLVRADRGTVLIFGRPHGERAVRSRALGGMLDGGRILYARLSVGENLEYLGVLRGLGRGEARERSRELLGRFGLAGRERDIFQKLSRGLQQRVALVACLVHKPRILILDEPTLGLDQEAQATVIEVLRELRHEGLTVLLTSHQLDIVERVSSRIAFIGGGVMRGVLDRTQLDAFARRPPRLAVRFESASLEGRLAPDPGFPVETVRGPGHTDLIVDAADIYRLLDLVRPCPVVSIERTRSALMSAYDAAFNPDKTDA